MYLSFNSDSLRDNRTFIKQLYMADFKLEKNSRLFFQWLLISFLVRFRPGRLTDGPYTSYDLNTLLKATAGKRRAVLLGQGTSIAPSIA